MPDIHARRTPEGLRVFCGICPEETDSIPAMVAHIDTAHDPHPDAKRWPDGGLVIDMSGVAELMVGGEA